MILSLQQIILHMSILLNSRTLWFCASTNFIYLIFFSPLPKILKSANTNYRASALKFSVCEKIDANLLSCDYSEVFTYCFSVVFLCCDPRGHRLLCTLCRYPCYKYHKTDHRPYSCATDTELLVDLMGWFVSASFSCILQCVGYEFALPA